MCISCSILTGKIRKAEREGNAEKARVMRSLLESHQRDHRIPIDEAVAKSPDVIVWPDGTQWIVDDRGK